MPTFTAKLDEFRQALAAALPHSGTDDTLPMLRGLYLKVDAGAEHGTVSATDRYSFARARFDLQASMPGVEAAEAYLTPADVKLILSAHKVPARMRSAKIDVTVDDRRVEIDGPATMSGHDNRIGDEPAARSGRAMFEEHLAAPEGEVGHVLWNAKLMSKFEKAVTHPSESVRASFRAKGKPIRIKVGERFEGLLMPVREPSE